MYVTFRNSTLALNPVDCGVIWKTLYVPEQREPIPAANRGVAFLDGRLFRGTGDGRLLALDAATGQELWRVAPADPTAGEWLSAAPIVWDHKVYVGVAGSDFGIRGRMLAFEPNHGHLVWQFNMVPQPPEFGADTWKGDTWRTGGGGTWSTVALDPLTGEVFVPVGNPAPDMILPARAMKSPLGQDLFTNSIVALDAKSGHLRWYFQATGADERDFDQAAAPILFELGDGRKVFAAASKDGYLRVVDRSTHQLIYKLPTTTIRNEGKPLTEKNLEVCPGTVGGTEWNGPAYDAREKTVVVGAVDWCNLMQRDAEPKYERGAIYFGGHAHAIMDPPPSGWITSAEAATGKVRWKFHAPAPVIAAITPTAGGLTFAGDQLGNFYALRSSDGTGYVQGCHGGRYRRWHHHLHSCAEAVRRDYFGKHHACRMGHDGPSLHNCLRARRGAEAERNRCYPRRECRSRRGRVPTRMCQLSRRARRGVQRTPLKGIRAKLSDEQIRSQSGIRASSPGAPRAQCRHWINSYCRITNCSTQSPTWALSEAPDTNYSTGGTQACTFVLYWQSRRLPRSCPRQLHTPTPRPPRLRT